ncbi:sigma-70 family RNA polymerase sigma factor [Nocardioides dubius]|uniref:SigB/SigF/SigG family RNA polymerase sigma factor n=2 Tax=Nocardioides dubius TaxID=317019 RepID=A0ABN1U023_9ACTN
MTEIARNNISVTELSRVERMTRTAELFEQAAQVTEDERAALLEEIILLNRCVAESIAYRYNDRGIAADDLRQTAYEGLVKAVHRFDPAQQKDLLTFAVPTIRGEIRRYFRDHGWMVRPPRGVQELQQRIRTTTDQLSHDLGREPSPTEVAEALEISVDDYQDALATDGCFQPASLDQPIGEDGAPVGERIADEDTEQSAAEARVLLSSALRELTEREKKLVYLRFFEGQTQAEIGAQLGVTQMQVSRLLSAINRKLREQIAGPQTAPGAGIGIAA